MLCLLAAKRLDNRCLAFYCVKHSYINRYDNGLKIKECLMITTLTDRLIL